MLAAVPPSGPRVTWGVGMAGMAAQSSTPGACTASSQRPGGSNTGRSSLAMVRAAPTVSHEAVDIDGVWCPSRLPRRLRWPLWGRVSGRWRGPQPLAATAGPAAAPPPPPPPPPTQGRLRPVSAGDVLCGLAPAEAVCRHAGCCGRYSRAGGAPRVSVAAHHILAAVGRV